jgi:hypothetical protein
MSAFPESRTDEAGNHTISGSSKSGDCEIQIVMDMLFEQISPSRILRLSCDYAGRTSGGRSDLLLRRPPSGAAIS